MIWKEGWYWVLVKETGEGEEDSYKVRRVLTTILICKGAFVLATIE